MSEDTELPTESSDFSTDDVRIDKVIYHIGWALDEFVEACDDFDPTVSNYDWSSVLQNMWAKTHARIRSQHDSHFKFKRCNDWSVIVGFALALNKQKLTTDINAELPNFEEIEEALWSQNRIEILPCDYNELEVLRIMVLTILQLQSYLYKHPDMAFEQLIQFRIAADQKKKSSEDKREARYLRRQAQKKKKRKRN